MIAGSAFNFTSAAKPTPASTDLLNCVTQEIELKEKKLRDLDAHLKSATIDQSVEIREALADLDGKNVEVKKLSDEARKLEADRSQMQMNLICRNENKIDESIKKLENQLQVRNFKLSDEKKIVTEINCLKKSKKYLQSYNLLNRTIDDKRCQLKLLRREKDSLQNQIQQMRANNDKIRRKLSLDHQMTGELEKDLEILMERKAVLESGVSVEEESPITDEVVSVSASDVTKSASDITTSASLKAISIETFSECTPNICTSNKQPNHNVCLDPSSSSEIPSPADLCRTCNILISYLTKLIPQQKSPESTNKTSPKESCLNLNDSDGVYLPRKKCEEHIKTSKKVRKEKKRNEKRLLVHPACIFDEFAKVDLPAPSHILGVQETFEKLQDKLKVYETLNQCNEAAHSLQKIVKKAVNENLLCLTDSESILNDASITTTPETTLSNDCSSMSVSHLQYKLSQDSGTCELDLVTSNLSQFSLLTQFQSSRNCMSAVDVSCSYISEDN